MAGFFKGPIPNPVPDPNVFTDWLNEIRLLDSNHLRLN